MFLALNVTMEFHMIARWNSANDRMIIPTAKADSSYMMKQLKGTEDSI
jgi:hypothetical protein